MGYDDMGYKLWKPYLRAVMERDMKLVGEGNKTKAEVLETSLQQMKACFLDARLNKVKLLEAMAIFFERSSRSGSDELHATAAVVRRCGLCQESDMVLRKNRDGNFMVGCLGFPQCRNVVWLPGSVLEAVVTTNTCNYCTPGPVYLIQFKFRQLEIPPNYSADHLGCIGGCDQILAQLTEICGRGPRMPARTGGPAASTSNAHHTNPRQGVCINCQETGHSSNDCPSRSTNVRHHRMSENNGEVSVSCSSCGTPCVLLTAHTAQNNGRKFYKCQTQECNFFLWEDSLNDGTGGSSGAHSNSGRGSHGRGGQNGSRGRGSRNGSHGRGGRNGSRGASTAFVSATGDPISGRCYVCGDPNHFANVCPNRGV